MKTEISVKENKVGRVTVSLMDVYGRPFELAEASPGEHCIWFIIPSDASELAPSLPLRLGRSEVNTLAKILKTFAKTGDLEFLREKINT